MDNKFSIFPQSILKLEPYDSISLKELYKIIRQDEKLCFTTNQYRGIYVPKEKEQYKRHEFKYVTPSGIFTSRRDDALVEYSGIVCLDLDRLTDSEMANTSTFLRTCPYVLLFFISPSGKGLKIFLKATTLENHKVAFNKYREYINEKCDVPLDKIDIACSNVSRACFICYDVHVYINPAVLNDAYDSIPTIELNKIDNDAKGINNINDTPADGRISLIGYSLDFSSKDLESNFKILIAINERKEGVYRSPREPWIQKLASLCNQFGMSYEKASKYMLAYFSGHPESTRSDKPVDIDKYIVNPVQDVYKRYASQFNIWEPPVTEQASVAETPVLPAAVFDTLPAFIRNVTRLYSNERERDMVFLATITVLSTCFPNYFGIYNDEKVWANLYVFIAAPAASGKGRIAAVRALGTAIERRFNDVYLSELVRYEEDMAVYEAERKNGNSPIKPIKPELKRLFLSANNTTSRIMQLMKRNCGLGQVMIEPEADTISTTLKSEHGGGISELLRKAFHHETHELDRKTNDEYIAIEKPFLSVILAGTPKQISRLVTGVENGLTSRFLFYAHGERNGFRTDIFKRGEHLPSDYFGAMSVDLLAFIDRISAFDMDEAKSIEFHLTESQQEKFIQWFVETDILLVRLYGDEIAPSFYRLALSIFRIAMILTIIRQMEVQAICRDVHCSDVDFNAAMDIVGCLLTHLTVVFNQLKQQDKHSKPKKNIALLFEKLPSSFTWNQAMDIAVLLNIKPKTAEGYMQKYKDDGMIEKLSKSQYKKL